MKWRQALVEAIAEQDDELLEMFFDGKELPIDRMKAALRRATIEGTVLPMLCGSAFKNKGVQPLLDAVVEYMPSPLDAKRIVGKDPKTGEELTRQSRRRAAVLRAGLQNRHRSIRKPDVFPRLLGHPQQRQLRLQLPQRP